MEKTKINKKEAEIGPFFLKKKKHSELPITVERLVISVTRFGDFLDFGQIFKALGNN